LPACPFVRQHDTFKVIYITRLHCLISFRSSAIGVLVQKYDILYIMFFFLFLQKVCITGLMMVLWNMASHQQDFHLNQHLEWNTSQTGLFILVVVLSVLVRLSNTGSLIAIERDWTKVIASGGDVLSQFNSSLKMVDLFCELLVPVFVSGLASALASNRSVLIILASFNVLCLVPESILLFSKVYQKSPKLIQERIMRNRLLNEQRQQQQNLHDKQHKGMESLLPSSTSKEELKHQEPQQQLTGTDTSLPSVTSAPEPTLLQLIRHPVFLTCISVSLLYANVLNPGSVVVSYLLSRGARGEVVAAITACAGVAGLFATLIFSPLARRIGLLKLGAISGWLQAMSLGLCLVAQTVFSNKSSAATAVFCTGLVISRVPLWTIDLAQTQLVQDSFSSGLGLIFGLQVSLQSFFEIVSRDHLSPQFPAHLLSSP
jgi:hypothetical protein